MNIFREKIGSLAASMALGMAVVLAACSEADTSAPMLVKPPLAEDPVSITRDPKPINHSRLMRSHYQEAPAE